MCYVGGPEEKEAAWFSGFWNIERDAGRLCMFVYFAE